MVLLHLQTISEITVTWIQVMKHQEIWSEMATKRLTGGLHEVWMLGW